MAENSPAYLFYPKDILSSGRVSALTPLEELWYRRALDQSWLHEGLPANPAEFAGWVGRGCTVKAAEIIITKFFIPHKKNSDKVVNPRQEKERSNLRKKIKQKSDAGKRGMANRWKQKGKADNTVITENNIPIPIPIPIQEEELREEKRREETPQAASPKKGTRLPDVFLLTSEMREYGKAKRPEIDLELETEKFCNFWRAKTGKDATKLNWTLTWKNWILNAKVNFNGNGQRKSEREKSADRGENAVRFIDELRRQGKQELAERQALSGGNGGSPKADAIAIESTKSD